MKSTIRVVEGETPKNLQARDVLDLIGPRLDLFHNENKNAYASIKDDDKSGFISLPIDSQPFRDWIIRSCWKRFNMALKKNPLEECIATLRAEACFDKPCYSVCIRVGMNEETIYLDLADNNGNFVKIDETGWEIVTETPLKFIRLPSMQPLPFPQNGGDFQDLFNFINIPEESQKLAIGWLVECFRTNTPYPLLVFRGLQGSAKSTTQELLRELIDPAQPNLRGAPKKREDLMVAAINNHIVSLNNVSRLSSEQQDDLCCMSTGGGYATRRLYTISQEQSSNIKRPVMLNGINEVVIAQDLIDRSISIELPIISENKRQTETDIRRNFNAKKPQILGALLNIVSGVLRELPSSKLDHKSRMADFSVLGVALERHLKWEIGSFNQAHKSHQSATRMSALEHCPVVLELVAWVNTVNEELVFSGSYGILYNILTSRSSFYKAAWPSSPKGLSEAIKRQALALKELGILIIFDRQRKNDGYHLSIRKVSTDLKRVEKFVQTEIESRKTNDNHTVSD